MDGGDDDWLAQAADRVIAGHHDFDANSFEDSERFEGDSECDSYGSMSEGMNWDWREAVPGGHGDAVQQVYSLDPRRQRSGRISVASDHSTATLQHSPPRASTSTLLPLAEISARSCARDLAFFQIESTYVTINNLKRSGAFPYLMDIDHLPISDSLPDKFFLSIVFHCFPATMHDFKLYSVLENGLPDHYNGGEALYLAGAVTEVVQIGYLITAVVRDDASVFIPSRINAAARASSFNVSLKVDRCKVIYCSCSCGQKPNSYCRHIVALALFRMKEPQNVQFRVTIWDAVNELSVMELKKFSQYLINELPREYLPIAQKLLDQLKDSSSDINCSHGAPDPTDGGHEAMATFSFDEANVNERIRKQLGMYCLPKAAVTHIDEIGNHRHMFALEFQKYLGPFVNVEPPALHNFIRMIRSMMLKRDSNATHLLRILTEECLANRLVLLHWYLSKLVQSNKWHWSATKSADDGHLGRQLHTSQLCDEIVGLWRYTVLNPALSREYREQLFAHLQRYHSLATERIFSIIKSSALEQNSLVGMLISNVSSNDGDSLTVGRVHFGIDSFPGFHSAMKACVALPHLAIPGVPHNPNFGLPGWSETAVPLQPELQMQVSPTKKKSKKKRRGAQRMRDRDRGERGDRRRHGGRGRREESSESGQESENDDHHGVAQIVFPGEDVAAVLAESYTPMDTFDVRFALCEAACSHGYHKQAAQMALDLTKSLLAHRESQNAYVYDQCLPSTSTEPQSFAQARSRSQSRIETLEKSLYLSNILLNHHSEHHTAARTFSFVAKVLQFPKFPMATKYFQVKEHYLEAELLKILQKLPIGERELQLLREAARKTAEVVEGGGIPPLGLVKFVFEELSFTANVVKFDSVGQPLTRGMTRREGRQPEDDDMALGAALCALGAKIHVLDKEYPMLHESIRYQKGQLAITLLCSYKECREKLGIILDRLLDPHVHLMYSKTQTNAAFLLKEAIQQKRCVKGQRPQFPYPPKHKEQQPVPAPPPPAAGDEQLQQQMESVNVGQQPQQRIVEFEPGSQGAMMKTKSGHKRNRVYNTATEALSSFMWDLAKRVLHVAGGNTSSVMFAAIHPSTGTHRNLHICSLIISLYAIGLHNRAKQQWQTRSYSQEVSWVMQQVPELGAAAYEIIRESNWEVHFTPSEIIAISEKTLSVQTPQATRESTLLALAVLPMAHMLQSQETKNTLQRCKDQGSEMLERACDAIMQSITVAGDALSAEVLFQVAKYWEELHLETFAQQQPQHMQHIMGAPPQQPHGMRMMGHPPQQPQMQPPQGNMIRMPPPQQQQPHPYSMGQHQMPPGHYQVPRSPPVYPPHQFTPQQLMNLRLQAPGSEVNRLHQSHSAPQLTGNQSGRGGDAFTPRLMKAFRVGLAGLTAMAKNQSEITRNHFTKHSPFKDEVEWLCGLAQQLGEQTSFEFFDAACQAVTCPYTLVFLSSKCYKLNLFCVNNRMQTPRVQSGVQYPQPRVNTNRTRHACLETGWPYHPTTVDLFEKCIDQFYKALSVRLNYNTFADSDRIEAESLLHEALNAFQLIPFHAAAIEHIMYHIKRQKNAKKDMTAVLASFESQLRAIYAQKMGYSNFSY